MMEKGRPELVGTATPMPPMPSLSQSLNRLSNRIGLLGDELGRLQPLATPRQQSAEANKAQEAKSPFARELDAMTERVDDLINFVASIEI